MPVNTDPKQRIPVPDGLRPLLESLAREVLRGQPSDIYAFSAMFFEKLIEFRKNHNGLNPIDNAELYDKFKLNLFTEAINKQLVSRQLIISSKGLNSDDSKISQVKKDEQRRQEGTSTARKLPAIQDANVAATKIQAGARGFLARRRVMHNKDVLVEARKERVIEPHAYSVKKVPGRTKKKKRLSESVASGATKTSKGFVEQDPDQAATKIQAGMRGYLTRKKYIEIQEKRNKAATKIQAGIKGHLTRKHLEAQGIPIHRISRSPSPLSHQEEHVPPPQKQKKNEKRPAPASDNVDEAASKIQAGIRGYLTRKHMEEKGLHVLHPQKRGAKSPSPGEPLITNSAENLASPLEDQTSIVSVRSSESNASGGGHNEAAAKIQAGVRGYLTRKHLNEKGIPVHAPSHHHHHHQKSPSPADSRTPPTSKIPTRKGGKNNKSTEE